MRIEVDQKRIITAVGAILFVSASIRNLGISLSSGRAGSSLIYDDVVYGLAGQEIAIRARGEGIAASLLGWLIGSPHAPFNEFVSILVHLIALDNSALLYVANGIVAAWFAYALAAYVSIQRQTRLLAATLLTLTPAWLWGVNEFRPDVFFALLACLALAYTLFGRPTSTGLKEAYQSGILLAITLFFLKPSWAALAMIVLCAVLAIGLLRLLFARSPLGQVVTPSNVAMFGFASGLLGFWYWWIGKRHFFDYVFNTLEREWTVTQSGFEAITASLQGVLSPASFWLLVSSGLVTAFVAGLLLVWSDRRGFLIRKLAEIGIAFLVPSLVLLATFVSAHPSIFQGRLFVLTLLVPLLALWRLILTDRVGTHPFRNSLGLSLFGAFSIFFMLAGPGLSTPKEFLRPDSVPERISRVIATHAENGCLPNRGSSPSVLVAFYETVSAEGILYHLRGSSGLLNAKILTPDPAAFELSAIANPLNQADYLVVRDSDYVHNGLPVNLLQDELFLAAEKHFNLVEVVEAEDIGSYAVFVTKSSCSA